MAYQLPKRFKWKTRKRMTDRWSYVEDRDKAVKFAGKDDHSKKYIKRVHAGT